MKKPSKAFVREMEKQYPKGATVTPHNETKKEERAEKKLPPAAYRKAERAEGERMKKGGMVRGKKC